MSTFERVSNWNKAVGKQPLEVGTNDYWLSLEQQFLRIQEELNELYEGIKAKDISNIIKEGSDLDVVVSGFNYLAGSDYNAVIGATLDNNDLKHTNDKTKAENWVQYHIDNGQNAVLNTVTDFTDLPIYSVVRAEDGKILKPGGHPKPDISEFIPEAVIQQFVLVKDAENIKESTQQFAEEHNLMITSLDTFEGQREAFEAMLDQHGDVILNIQNTTLIGVQTVEDNEQDLEE